jgi:hypothetical protein
MKKILLIALFVLTIFISSAFAIIEIQGTIREITSDYWSETKKIGANEYLTYRFQGVSTDTINVTIEVVSGDSIDTFILSSENFSDYLSMVQSGRAKPYKPYSTGKGLDLKYITYSFKVPEDGTYYIVEDNSYIPNNGGTPGGSVEVNIKFDKSRCFECEEAALEARKSEEAARQYEEAQRKLQEEMNKSKETESTPGFEIMLSALVLVVVFLSGRKKI